MKCISVEALKPDNLLRNIGFEAQQIANAYTFWGMRISDWELNTGTRFSRVSGAVRIAVHEQLDDK